MTIGIIESAIVGIVSGLVSAIIFHCILKKSSPKIIISDEIEKREVNGKSEYRIKVVNLQKHFAVNVKPYLVLVHSQNGVNGLILRTKQLKVYEEDLPYIDPFNKKDADCKYAVRFRVTENLEVDWNNTVAQHLEIRIYCVDEFSGAGKLFVKNYYSPSCIVKGNFKTGKSLEIVQ